MTNLSPETINVEKAKFLLSGLTSLTQGPREAYGVLVLAIYLLNFEFHDTPVSIDQLAVEVSDSLRSIQRVELQ